MDLLREKMRLLPMSGPQDGGGGGGGGSGTQTTIAELPEWARPYAQNILAKGEALTTSTTPATYGGDRYAGLSDLQKKAIESVSTPEAYNKSLQGFMDPYAQNVIDIQKREAGRQSQMAGLQEAGQAVKAGAFGGSRAGLVEAERARNTGQLMSDIQARGSEAAFQNAQQALQRDITNKMQLGSVQQADLQRPMDIAYQDFLNQQNYPYKQLGFMSDLLRGTPTGSSSVTNMYQPISGAQTLAGLGMGAYGMSKLFAKDGGLMESSYAEGGSVDSPDNVAEIVGNLSDAQLEQAAKAAQSRGDFEQLQIIQAEKAMRVSERGGLAGAFNNLPYPTRARMASGGIVAFNEPTAANNYSLVSSEDGENDGVIQTSSPGDPITHRDALRAAMGYTKDISGFKEATLSDEEIDNAIQRRYALEQKLAGASPYADLNKHIAESEAGLGDYAEKAKGFAALKAMGAIMQPGGLIRGLGAAGGAFGDAMEKSEQATRAEKRSLASMKFNLKDAERKERMGMTRSAVSAASEAIKDKRDAERSRLKVLETQANVAAKIAQAAKPVGSGSGRAPQPKESVAQIASLAAKIRKDNPGMDEVDVQDSATRQYFSMNKPGTSGAVAKTYGDAQKEFRSFVTLNKSKVDKIVNDRFGGDFEAYKEDQIGRILQGLPTDIYSAKQPGATRPKTTARGSTPTPPPGFVPQ